MNAPVRKSATIHRIRQAENLAFLTGRTVKTTYYQYSDKAATMKVTRSTHSSTAAPNVIMHMQRNDYEARVADVWDENKNLLIVTVVRDINGEITIVYYVDPITGEKLRPQPGEVAKKGLSEKQFNNRMLKVTEALKDALDAELARPVVDSLFDEIDKLRAQRKPT